MKLTIVMYHYVRQLKNSLFPEINGLETELFKEQVAFIKKYYNVISAYELMDAIQFGSSLPPNAILLSFDDGFIDHFTQVFPVLDKEKIPGCFFPSAKPIVENKVLDVNKIHFIIASTPKKNLLVDYVFRALDEYRDTFQLESNDYYWQKCGIPNRFDPAETNFVKRMLQRYIPEKLRSILTERLFEHFVSTDGVAFSQELYMSLDQLSYLQNNNMYIGSHGYEHCWSNSVSLDAQKKEVDLSLQFLEQVGSDTSRWIMSYPYGGYDESLLSILREKNCKAGFGTEVEIADLSKHDPLILPRLDVNDLPKDANAAPNKWVQKIRKSENAEKEIWT